MRIRAIIYGCRSRKKQPPRRGDGGPRPSHARRVRPAIPLRVGIGVGALRGASATASRFTTETLETVTSEDHGEDRSLSANRRSLDMSLDAFQLLACEGALGPTTSRCRPPGRCVACVVSMRRAAIRLEGLCPPSCAVPLHLHL